jgi:hypothetical protein
VTRVRFCCCLSIVPVISGTQATCVDVMDSLPGTFLNVALCLVMVVDMVGCQYDRLSLAQKTEAAVEPRPLERSAGARWAVWSW